MKLGIIKKLKSEYNTSEWIKICSFTIGGDIQEWFIDTDKHDVPTLEKLATDIFKNNNRHSTIGSLRVKCSRVTKRRRFL